MAAKGIITAIFAVLLLLMATASWAMGGGGGGAEPGSVQLFSRRTRRLT